MTRQQLGRWTPIPIRLIVGYGFIAHGLAKMARGPEAFAGVLQGIGVPWPHTMSWATILVELLGGLAIILGALVPLVSLPMIVVLIVAALTVHLPYGFSSVKLMSVTKDGAQFGKPGYEVNLLYISCLIALLLGGPGPLAIDNLRRSKIASSKS